MVSFKLHFLGNKSIIACSHQASNNRFKLFVDKNQNVYKSHFEDQEYQKIVKILKSKNVFPQKTRPGYLPSNAYEKF